jgi:ATP synthase protein I
VLEAAVSLSVNPANAASNTRRGHEDEADERPFKRLTRAEADALRARQPVLSPWRVVAAQAGFGALIAVLAWLVTGSRDVAASALYGALVVVIPAALMARGTTSRLSRLSVATSAFSVLFWSMVKMATSVLMLVLAPKVVQGLSWPALLIALVLCMQTYWFALLWRARSKN